jgi:hypothetical protein
MTARQQPRSNASKTTTRPRPRPGAARPAAPKAPAEDFGEDGEASDREASDREAGDREAGDREDGEDGDREESDREDVDREDGDVEEGDEVDDGSGEIPEAHASNGDEDVGLDVAADGSRPPLREDPALDRRIIEGMLKDRKELLDELAKEGMTQNMVLRRAAELGLSEALLRQVKGVAADLAGERPGRRPMPSSLGARTCLSCDRVFLSTGPGNRLCMRCRGGDAGLAQF